MCFEDTRPGGRTATAANGVGDLDELPLETEAVGEVCRERLDAEPLGRVVSRREQVDPELARGRGARLLRLAGEEGVVALVRGPDEVVPGGPGRDGEALDLPVAAAQHERRAPDDACDARGEVVDRDGVDRAAEPDDVERPDGVAPIRAASCALLPRVGWASSARW